MNSLTSAFPIVTPSDVWPLAARLRQGLKPEALNALDAIEANGRWRGFTSPTNKLFGWIGLVSNYESSLLAWKRLSGGEYEVRRALCDALDLDSAVRLGDASLEQYLSKGDEVVHYRSRTHTLLARLERLQKLRVLHGPEAPQQGNCLICHAARWNDTLSPTQSLADHFLRLVPPAIYQQYCSASDSDRALCFSIVVATPYALVRYFVQIELNESELAATATCLGFTVFLLHTEITGLQDRAMRTLLSEGHSIASVEQQYRHNYQRFSGAGFDHLVDPRLGHSARFPLLKAWYQHIPREYVERVQPSMWLASYGHGGNGSGYKLLALAMAIGGPAVLDDAASFCQVLNADTAVAPDAWLDAWLMSDLHDLQEQTPVFIRKLPEVMDADDELQPSSWLKLADLWSWLPTKLELDMRPIAWDIRTIKEIFR